MVVRYVCVASRTNNHKQLWSSDPICTRVATRRPIDRIEADLEQANEMVTRLDNVYTHQEVLTGIALAYRYGVYTRVGRAMKYGIFPIVALGTPQDVEVWRACASRCLAYLVQNNQ
jgi:hypothetical protein